MRRRQRHLFGKWLPAQVNIRTSEGVETIPVEVDSECSGLALHSSNSRSDLDLWTITHTPTGMAVMHLIPGRYHARKALKALCAAVRERCGFTWGDIKSENDRDKIGCAYTHALLPVEKDMPSANKARKRRR